ncbi:MAG TPA: DUF411 domain-containing protein [Vicinamibacterales bacterium]|nr:DUF411 domain-containing protein [Vicinamibacterales bacterium]
MLSRLVLALLVAVTVTGPAVTAQVRQAKAPMVEVFKTPTCGCCSKWVDHIRDAGFEVRATDMSQEELDKVKAKHHVPAAVHSCHTALVSGYVVEGHVPAAEVKRLLKERPKVVGIAVPGMPLGSPGMEVSGIKPHPYDVLTFDKTGNTKVFATIKP